MAASYKSINYLLRPNKCVERRMMLALLQALAGVCPIHEYRYLGLGSMWFADFLLIHRGLGIQNLSSIERKEGKRRADFNAPFRCVTVLEGDSVTVLPTLEWPSQAVVWMDYDGGLDESVWKDVQLLCERLPEGSVLFVSVNAEVGTYGRDKDSEVEDRLREIAGDHVPTPFDKSFLQKKGFRALIGQILLSKMLDSVRDAGREERFHPLAHFSYSDGAEMVTVGGIVGSTSRLGSVAALGSLKALPFALGAVQYRIHVPHLTPKEKLALDRHQPFIGGKKLPNDVSFLDQDLFRHYCELYMYYPLFGEVAF